MNNSDNPTLAAAMILGQVASTGLARGPAMLCDCARRSTAIPRREVSEAEARMEMDRFDAAVVAAEGELLAIQDRVRRTLGEDEAEVFEVQILLMRDVELRDAVRALCFDKRMNVEAAVDEAIKQLSVLFASLEDAYFRERASDLHDVGRRLLDQLAQGGQPISPALPDGCVVVTSDLLVSVVAQLEGRSVGALIVEKGGLTTHATILARSLGIPMLVHVANACERLRTDSQRRPGDRRRPGWTDFPESRSGGSR